MKKKSFLCPFYTLDMPHSFPEKAVISSEKHALRC